MDKQTWNQMVIKISWQPSHLNCNWCQSDINWFSHQRSAHLSYRFIMVGNFRHRLARSICYILVCILHFEYCLRWGCNHRFKNKRLSLVAVMICIGTHLPLVVWQNMPCFGPPLQVMKKLNHPNIIRCYGYFWDYPSQSLYIASRRACVACGFFWSWADVLFQGKSGHFQVLEYANRGDLHTELQPLAVEKITGGGNSYCFPRRIWFSNI